VVPGVDKRVEIRVDGSMYLGVVLMVEVYLGVDGVVLMVYWVLVVGGRYVGWVGRVIGRAVVGRVVGLVVGRGVVGYVVGFVVGRGVVGLMVVVCGGR